MSKGPTTNRRMEGILTDNIYLKNKVRRWRVAGEEKNGTEGPPIITSLINRRHQFSPLNKQRIVSHL